MLKDTMENRDFKTALKKGIINTNIKVEAQVEEEIKYFTITGMKLVMFGNNLIMKVNFDQDIVPLEYEQTFEVNHELFDIFAVSVLDSSQIGGDWTYDDDYFQKELQVLSIDP